MDVDPLFGSIEEHSESDCENGRRNYGNRHYDVNPAEKSINIRKISTFT